MVHGGVIYIAGALTGRYPGETPVPHLYLYDTRKDVWRQGDAIPAERRRGSTGNAIHDGKLYLVGGIVDGHRGDHKKWFDSYDLDSGKWERLPDAPRARDHFQVAVVNDRLYVIGGRRSEAPKNTFSNTVSEIDVYDFMAKKWSTLETELPTPRAGLFLHVVADEILAIGGETGDQKSARNEVESLNTKTSQWRSLAPLRRGRHGTGAAEFAGRLYVASGSGNRGGSPELTSQESIALDSVRTAPHSQ